MFDFSFPSKEKLNSLRKKGIVYSSKFVLSISVLLAFSISMLVSKARLGKFFNTFKDAYSSLLIKDFEQAKEIISPLLIQLFLFPSIIALAILLLLSLLQSRFLFNLGLISLDFSKLNPFRRLREVKIVSILTINVVLLPVICLVTFIIVRVFISKTFNLLNMNYENLEQGIGSIFSSILFNVILISTVLIPIVYLIGLFSFYFKHRMKEGEAPSEDKQYIKRV